MWEFRSLAQSATVRQFPRAEPQKQKYVHMVSVCLSGETLILSCHQVAEMPALSHHGMLRFALVSQHEQLCVSALRGPPTPLLPVAFQAEGCFQIWPSSNMLVLFFTDTHSQRSKPEGDFVIGCTISFIVQLLCDKSPRH